MKYTVESESRHNGHTQIRDCATWEQAVRQAMDNAAYCDMAIVFTACERNERHKLIHAEEFKSPRCQRSFFSRFSDGLTFH